MIAEFFTWLTTQCPQYVRAMGYLKEAIAIEARHKRCKRAWSSHLENSKDFIIKSVKRCENLRKVVVLGSGNLLDVPLLQLSQNFDKVVLADIIHLPKTLRGPRKFHNVEALSCDVTAVAGEIYSLCKNRSTKAERIVLPEPKAFFPLEAGTDLVISLNILSQLTVMPREYILKNNAFEDGTVFKRWEHNVLKAHLDALMSLESNVCLITDFEFTERNHRTETVNHYYTLTGLELPVPERMWNWSIAPQGEISGDISIERKVAAFFFPFNTKLH
ncbi:MAG: hypothetical protein H7844_06955 [Nitrospirae bacterium YQR-1]